MRAFEHEAKRIVKHILENEAADPAAVAQELGLTFRGEQDWPGTGKLWDFTMMDQSSPYAATTFYTKAGASREEIINRWNEKRAAEDAAVGRA
jgi:hypothetical protein